MQVIFRCLQVSADFIFHVRLDEASVGTTLDNTDALTSASTRERFLFLPPTPPLEASTPLKRPASADNGRVDLISISEVDDVDEVESSPDIRLVRVATS